MTDPLFVVDLPTLQAKLRLSGVPSSNTDGTAILDECILRARLAFYKRLGTGRVSQLLATPFNENPSSEADLLRALANTTEVALVYCRLLDKLPNVFLDSSGSVKRDWNEEALTREKAMQEVGNERMRCQNMIELDMQVLAGEQSLGEVSEILVWDGEPDCPRSPPSGPIVGRSLRGSTRHFPLLTQDPPTL